MRRNATWLVIYVTLIGSFNTKGTNESYSYVAYNKPVHINTNTKPTKTITQIAQIRAQSYEALEKEQRNTTSTLYKALSKELASIDQEALQAQMKSECPCVFGGTEPQKCQKCIQIIQTLIAYAPAQEKEKLNQLFSELLSNHLQSELLRSKRNEVLQYLDKSHT